MAAGLQNAGDLIRAAAQPKVVVGFHRLQASAVEFAAGFAGNGTPLYELLTESYPLVVDAIASEPVSSLALRPNPVQTARKLRDQFGIAFDRSLVIARTEQLRPYRLASLMQYRESGIVRGYRRVAAKSVRTCMACLIADGRFYPVDEPFEEHPQGHCTSVPVVIDAQEITWETGPAWFMRQPQHVQCEMMGKKTYAAWKDGLFKLGDIVHRHEDDVWGIAWCLNLYICSCQTSNVVTLIISVNALSLKILYTYPGLGHSNLIKISQSSNPCS